MRVDVVMPQMGESIAEGTITRWIKNVGDKVDRDEPLFEISTDKVDAEIPSPAAGTLAEIRNREGDTVEVNRVVAVIDTAAATGAAGDGAAAKGSAAAPGERAGAERGRSSAGGREPAASKPAAAGEAAESESAEEDEAAASAGPPETERAEAGAGSGRFYSPVVRRMAAEHDLDLERLEGSGAGGRVTKKDVLAHLEARERGPAEPQRPATRDADTPRERGPAASPRPAARGAEGAPEPARTERAAAPARSPAEAVQPDAPTFSPDEPVVRVGMTQMRKKIAEHMLASRRTSAHVHSVFEIDMTRVVRLRERYKQVYLERHGTKLTFMPFFLEAVCDALRAWPIVNASVEGQEIVYHRDLNIGIAVALDWGLIVPVVRNADELSMAGVSKRVNDLAERARSKKLNPDEVHGGTFTVTNPGVFGGLFGLPVINQPQVAILGIGGIKKRPVIVDDAIAIRSMMIVALSYDHRVVDGAVADQFLARFQRFLEEFDESLL